MCITSWEKLNEALEMNEKTLMVRPDFDGAYQNLGILYNELGQEDRAINAYQKVLDINPSFARAHNNLAVIYFKKNEFAKALNHVNRAQRLGYKVNPLFLKALAPYQN